MPQPKGRIAAAEEEQPAAFFIETRTAMALPPEVDVVARLLNLQLDPAIGRQFNKTRIPGLLPGPAGQGGR
jgi:hypothetical protein